MRAEPCPSRSRLDVCAAVSSTFTMSELMRMLEPPAVDRWSFELASKDGMRDSLNCPVGRRWVVTYWSRKSCSLSDFQRARAPISSWAPCSPPSASEARRGAGRPDRQGRRATPRELAVLRMLAAGHQMKDTASFSNSERRQFAAISRRPKPSLAFTAEATR